MYTAAIVFFSVFYIHLLFSGSLFVIFTGRNFQLVYSFVLKSFIVEVYGFFVHNISSFFRLQLFPYFSVLFREFVS